MMQEDGEYWKQFLEKSSVPLYQKLAERTVVPTSFIENNTYNENGTDDYWKGTKGGAGVTVWDDYDVMPNMLKENVTENGTHVYLTNVIDGKFKIPQTDFKRHNTLDDFYISKEELNGTSPWGGWIMNKEWPLQEELNMHILWYQQVCSWTYLINSVGLNIPIGGHLFDLH